MLKVSAIPLFFSTCWVTLSKQSTFSITYIPVHQGSTLPVQIMRHNPTNIGCLCDKSNSILQMEDSSRWIQRRDKFFTKINGVIRKIKSRQWFRGKFGQIGASSRASIRNKIRNRYKFGMREMDWLIMINDSQKISIKYIKTIYHFFLFSIKVNFFMNMQN